MRSILTRRVRSCITPDSETLWQPETLIYCIKVILYDIQRCDLMVHRGFGIFCYKNEWDLEATPKSEIMSLLKVNYNVTPEDNHYLIRRSSYGEPESETLCYIMHQEKFYATSQYEKCDWWTSCRTAILELVSDNVICLADYAPNLFWLMWRELQQCLRYTKQGRASQNHEQLRSKIHQCQ